MKAKFAKRYIWSIICLCCGLFVTVMLTICVFKGDYDAIIGVVFCVVYTIGSIMSLFVNRNAYLVIEDGYIKGKYHLFGKIDAPVSNVDFVSAQPNALTVQLKDGKVHRILGVENSWDLCFELRRQISCDVSESVDELIVDLNKNRSLKKKGIIFLCIGLALMFINIFITVLLTEERNFVNFGNIDWIIFSIFCVVEIITVVVTFGIAAKTGKLIFFIEKNDYNIRRKMIETKELLPGEVIKVYTDNGYVTRITLFGYPNSDSVYFSLEQMDFDYSLKCYNKSQVYENIDELSELLEQFIDISEKFAK